MPRIPLVVVAAALTAPSIASAPLDAPPTASPAADELLWRALAASPDGVALVDADGMCVRANDVLAALVGAPDAASVVGRPWDALCPAGMRTASTPLADGRALWVVHAEPGTRIAAPPVGDVWYRLLFEESARPAWIYDTETLRFLAVNPVAEAHYGWTAAQFRELRLLDVYPPRDRARAAEWVRTAGAAPSRAEERRHVTRDGRVRHVEVSTHPLTYAGRPARLALVEDVTERRQLEAAIRENELRFRGVLEHLRAVAVCLDLEGRVTFINDFALALVGRTRDQVLGREWFDEFFPDPAAAAERYGAAMAEAIMGDASAASAHDETELVTHDGDRRLVAWDILALRDGSWRVTGAAAVGRDVTEQRRAEETLRELSMHDELTGLLNRRGFRQMVAHEAKVVARTRRNDALLYLDLDRFKPINDTYGHAAGDDALRAVAEILEATVRDADFVGRLGGDEFAVYAVGLVSRGEGHVLASRLRTALAAHNMAAQARGRPYEIAFSIGVADVVPGEDLDTTLAHADAELYAAKQARRR